MYATGSHRLLNTSGGREHGVNAPLYFTVCVFATLICSIISLSQKSVSIPTWVDTSNRSACVRVQRLENAAIANVAVGTPPRVLRLLIRMDSLVADRSKATVVFAEELLRSSSLECNDQQRCSDIALLTTSTNGKQMATAVELVYINELAAGLTVASALGLDGAMELSSGLSYELTETHFCWSEEDANGSQEGAVASLDEAGLLELVSLQTPSFTDLPAAACNNSRALLFPHEAALEQSWLALSSSFLFESYASQLDERRKVVERGLDCSGTSSVKLLYQHDCSFDAIASCKVVPSVPFRNFNEHTIKISPVDNKTISIGVKRLPSLARMGSSVTFAILRLLVLLVVAFVVYARAERKAGSARHVIADALDVASGTENSAFSTNFEVWTDAAVGVLAIVARLTVLALQGKLLAADGHVDCIIFESVGIFASIIHFVLRNFVLAQNIQGEGPISKLGGSMAIADASVAALIAGATVPLLAVSENSFDSVARLFVAGLVAALILHRLWFSAAACGLLAKTMGSEANVDPNYSKVLYTASLLWLVQSASVGFGFGRFFVLPQAYSAVRASGSDATLMGVAILMGAFCAGLPMVNSVLVSLKRRL